MAPRAAPWAIASHGLSVSVRLTPKGGRDAIDGIEHLADGQAVLKVRVRAAPSDGAANAALIRLLAQTLGVAPSQVTLVSGATGRLKRLTIAGKGVVLAAPLEKMTGTSG